MEKINNICEVRKVTKDYQVGKTIVPALRGVDIEIENGEFLAVAGPSGSGKTTFLNLLGCLDRPTAGSIEVVGVETTALNDKKQADFRNYNLGFVFQTFNLIPVLTAFENVEFPLLLQNENATSRHKKVEDILIRVGLKDLMKRKPAELSGGQQQRVAIARALVKSPKIVLADEPTANLDSSTSEEILNLMREMNQEKGTTFIFSTHDPLVMKYAHRLVEIRDGLIKSDQVKELVT